MKQRLMCTLLALVMLFGLLPLNVGADGLELGMPLIPEGESYVEMTTSQSMVDMMKDFEGFRSEPYWDVSQWSIGYGSCCGTDPDEKPDLTVTEEEAEAMLMELLAEDYGKKVNEYCAKIGRQPTQQQFDALVDFTYNLGSSWMDGCMLDTWLENPTTALDLVNAMGRWCRVSGSINYVITTRRIREAIVFLRGEYYLAYGDGTFESELELVGNHDLPYYKAVIFQAGEGIFETKSDEVQYYVVGEAYGSFPQPSREGYLFAGWQVTRERNSKLETPYTITEDAVVQENLELTAVWEVDPDAPVPTEPEETEPDPTESEPTDPTEWQPVETEPTEPEGTEPVETEPTEPEETEPTEPEGTEPVETESTEPEETEPTEPEPSEPTEWEPADPEPTEPEIPDVGEDDVELPFRDVPRNAWYRKSVEFVYQNGYMSGVSATQFGPSTSVTRGMMIQILYRIAGSPEVSEADAAFFTDTQNAYYTDAAGWARANGIASGISETRFGPERRLTRQDAMTIFYRYCVDYLGLDGSCSGDLDGFDDADRVADYAETAVSWAVDRGLLSGSAEGGTLLLNPRGNMTRAEAATVLRALVLQILESI